MKWKWYRCAKHIAGKEADMRYMKRFAVVLVVLLLVGAVSGISQESLRPGKGMVFYFISNGQAGDPFWAVAQAGAERAAHILGLKVVTEYYAGDAAKAMTLMEVAIAAEPAGLIVSVTQIDAMRPCFEEAHAKGIPVVTVINDIDAPRLAYFGPTVSTIEGFLEQGYPVGVAVRDLIKQKWPGEKIHILMSGEFPAEPYCGGFDQTTQRSGRFGGFLNALDEIGLDYTYEVLDAGYETAATEAAITTYLVAHPETKVAYSGGGLTTERTGVAVKRLGYEPGEIIVAGFDLLPETITSLREGYMQAIGLQQQGFCLFNAVMSLYNAVAYPGFTLADYIMGLGIVTPDNVDRFIDLVDQGVM